MGLFSKSVQKEAVRSVIIVAVGIVIIWIVLLIGFGTMNPFYVVASGSMIPALEVYDVLVVQGNIPFEDVRLGDIIVFNRPSDHNRVIVHRVISFIDDNPKAIMTKGDANRASIPGTDYPITQDEYIGKVVYTIPDIGYATQALKPPVNYIIIAIIIGVVIMKQVKKSRKDKVPLDSEEPEPSYDMQDMTDLKRDPEYEDAGIQGDAPSQDKPHETDEGDKPNQDKPHETDEGDKPNQDKPHETDEGDKPNQDKPHETDEGDKPNQDKPHETDEGDKPNQDKPHETDEGDKPNQDKPHETDEGDKPNQDKPHETDEGDKPNQDKPHETDEGDKPNQDKPHETDEGDKPNQDKPHETDEGDKPNQDKPHETDEGDKK